MLYFDLWTHDVNVKQFIQTHGFTTYKTIQMMYICLCKAARRAHDNNGWGAWKWLRYWLKCPQMKGWRANVNTYDRGNTTVPIVWKTINSILSRGDMLLLNITVAPNKINVFDCGIKGVTAHVGRDDTAGAWNSSYTEELLNHLLRSN